MASASLPGPLKGLLLSTILLRSASASAIDMAICANINTASTAGNSSIYQSDGLCFNFCIADFAYAVIKGNECWCSDYTPSKSQQVSVSECGAPCPGYTSDTCGGDSVYGYMTLTKSPSGTAGGGSSSTTSPSTKPPVTTTFTKTAPTSSSSSSSSTSSSSTQSSTTTPSPVVQTVTTGGVVQTVTVTPSPNSSSGEGSSITSQHTGLSTGAAVGIAIGVIVAVVLAAVVAFCVWRRKRRNQEAEDALFVPNNPKTPSPRGSSPHTSNSPGVAEVNGAPAFARRPGEGQWENDQSGRRRSTLMPIDPRIDPQYSDIYTRPDNKSRDSVNSLRDDHDYSRRVLQPAKVLRATNPDPDDD